MKIDTNNLYVACHVYDYEIELEPWVQYDSFGRIEHNIIVDPKRILVIKKDLGNGKSMVLDCNTFEEMIVTNYTSSFESTSSCCQTLYLSDWPLGPLSKDRKEYFNRKKSEIQFLIPLSEYVKQRLGIEIREVSLLQAKTLLNLINMSESRSFKLSFDEEEASKQIEQKVYKHRPEKTKRR